MSAIRKSKKQKKGKVIQLNVFRQPDQLELEKMLTGVLNVAQAGLWPNQVFSDKEKLVLKKLIADHFLNGKNNKNNFKDLLERICLAKRYVARKRGRYISKPQDWLNIHYPLGLSGTNSWLEKVKEVRCNVPEYNKGIQTFAKAVLSFIENPCENTFFKYRKQLVEQRQFDLLQIFYASIINLQYSN